MARRSRLRALAMHVYPDSAADASNCRPFRCLLSAPSSCTETVGGSMSQKKGPKLGFCEERSWVEEKRQQGVGPELPWALR